MPKIVPQKPRPRTPDEFLRGAGFRIFARPAKGEAVWERGGRLFRHSEATACANDEWVRALDEITELGTKW